MELFYNIIFMLFFLYKTCAITDSEKKIVNLHHILLSFTHPCQIIKQFYFYFRNSILKIKIKNKTFLCEKNQ